MCEAKGNFKLYQILEISNMIKVVEIALGELSVETAGETETVEISNKISGCLSILSIVEMQVKSLHAGSKRSGEVREI